MPPKPSQSNKITDVFKVKRKPGRPRNTTLDIIVETGGGKPPQAKRLRRGKPPLISYEKQDFIIEVILRADRANEGMPSLAIYDMIEALCPELKRKQIAQA